MEYNTTFCVGNVGFGRSGTPTVVFDSCTTQKKCRSSFNRNLFQNRYVHNLRDHDSIH